VPVFIAIQPIIGQLRTSLFATNRIGLTASSARMSSQEIWLQTKSVEVTAPGGALPCHTIRTFNMSKALRAHQVMTTPRSAGLCRGKTYHTANAP